jgi:2,5-diamino-6-(ribosylamino)-4(3H)-pyrimidinone 5'-phosphate reductase
MQSLDGKITTGTGYARTFEKDFLLIPSLNLGLKLYSDIKNDLDKTILNSGKSLVRAGINDHLETPQKSDLNMVVIDNYPHLNEIGITYLAKSLNKLYIVTSNENHPAHDLYKNFDNIELICFKSVIDFKNLLNKLKDTYEISNITISSGGTLNAEFVRRGLIDRISLLIAPCLIGGEKTSSLIDGESLELDEELNKIKTLKLLECSSLEASYLHLVYEVNP